VEKLKTLLSVIQAKIIESLQVIHAGVPTLIYTLLVILGLYLIWIVFQYYLIWKMCKTMNVIQFLLPKDNENEPHQMNLACKSLWKIYPWYIRIYRPQLFYSFEIHAKPDEITFNIVAPDEYTETVEKIIHSVYKDAESRIFPVNSKEDYMAGYRKSHSSVGKVNLLKHYVFSLQTFKDWTQDPLSTITSSMTKLEDGQEVTLQIMCRPMSNTVWQYLGRKILHRYEVKGRIPTNSSYIWNLLIGLISFPFKVVSFILSAIFLTSSHVEKKKAAKLEAAEKENNQGQIELKEQKSMSGKVTQHGFNVVIRLISKDNHSSGSIRRQTIRDIANTLNQLDAENQMKRQHIILVPSWLKFCTVNRFLYLHNGKNILSTDELASLFHLPNKDVLTPYIKRIKSKQAPPPPEASRTTNLFAESRYRGKVEPIGIEEADLDKSVYLLGKQGEGKTQVLENIFGQGVRNKDGGAIILLDPAGDMAESVIGCIPEEDIENTYYINFGDFDYPPSINVLDQSKLRSSTGSLLKEQTVGLLKKEFKDAWGASTEDIIRNALELSLVSEGSSLMEVMLAITSEDFRREYLDKTDNFVVRGYWKNEFEKLPQSFRAQSTNAPLNKLRRITGSAETRNILCQKRSTVDLAWLFDNKKYIVVNLAKGRLGEENSRFLGSMMISYIYLLLLERQQTIPDKNMRPKLTVIVDELQNYVSESVADFLAELRKYGGRMIAGHQYRSQFDNEKVKTGIYQLSRTKIFFNIGEDDAEYVGQQLAPRFTASDLTSLEKYQCIVKLLANGYEHPPFTVFTLPPLYPYDQSIADRVIQRSRELFYAGPEAIQDIKDRYRRFVPDDNEIELKTPELKPKGNGKAGRRKKEKGTEEIAAPSSEGVSAAAGELLENSSAGESEKKGTIVLKNSPIFDAAESNKKMLIEEDQQKRVEKCSLEKVIQELSKPEQDQIKEELNESASSVKIEIEDAEEQVAASTENPIGNQFISLMDRPAIQEQGLPDMTTLKLEKIISEDLKEEPVLQELKEMMNEVETKIEDINKLTDPAMIMDEELETNFIKPVGSTPELPSNEHHDRPDLVEPQVDEVAEEETDFGLKIVGFGFKKSKGEKEE
jgi:hypothetical protein